MIIVKVRNGEPFEKAMRRFKRKVENEGIMKDIKKRQFYLTKSEKRKAKRKLAAKRRKRANTRNL
jgi:small subunit ribosomal protein S21